MHLNVYTQAMLRMAEQTAPVLQVGSAGQLSSEGIRLAFPGWEVGPSRTWPRSQGQPVPVSEAGTRAPAPCSRSTAERASSGHVGWLSAEDTAQRPAGAAPSDGNGQNRVGFGTRDGGQLATLGRLTHNLCLRLSLCSPTGPEHVPTEARHRPLAAAGRSQVRAAAAAE